MRAYPFCGDTPQRPVSLRLENLPSHPGASRSAPTCRLRLGCRHPAGSPEAPVFRARHAPPPPPKNSVRPFQAAKAPPQTQMFFALPGAGTPRGKKRLLPVRPSVKGIHGLQRLSLKGTLLWTLRGRPPIDLLPDRPRRGDWLSKFFETKNFFHGGKHD